MIEICLLGRLCVDLCPELRLLIYLTLSSVAPISQRVGIMPSGANYLQFTNHGIRLIMDSLRVVRLWRT